MLGSLVNQATSDDQKHVNGSILKELAQQTLDSIKECDRIQADLLKRLAKTSPDIKVKALRTIKYICQNGRTDFRISLQRNNTEIRSLLHFTAPLDPLRGDQPAVRVREAAKEALDAIFNTSGGPRGGPTTVGRIEGYGSQASGSTPESSWYPPSSSSSLPTSRSSEGVSEPDWSGPGTFSTPVSSSGEVLPIASGAYSTGKMVGFGNPAFAPSKPGIFSKVGSFLSSSDSNKSKPTPTFRPFEQPGPYGGPTTSAYSPEDQTAGEMAFVPRTGTRKRGTPGGLWSSESPAGGMSGRGGGGGGGGYSDSKHGVSTTTHAPLGEYELRLIDTITTPSGVRVVPTSKELSDFRKQCETFDAYEISAALDKKLLSDLLPTKLKALYVIESLMKREGSAGEIVEDYFNDNPQNLLQLESGQILGNKAIQEKATQLLVLCGAKSPPVTSPLSTTPAPIPAPIPTPTPTQVTTTTTTESLIPDFSGMQVTTTPSPAPAPTTVKPFNLFDEDPSTESSGSSSSGGGIFGDLDIRTPAPISTPTPQPVKPVQPSLPPPTTTPVDDPFGILSQPPPVQPKKVDRVSQLLNSPSTLPPSTPYQPSPYQQQPPFYQSPSHQQQPPLYNGYPPYQPSYSPYGPTGYQPQPQQPYYPHQNPMYGGLGGGGFPPTSGSGGMWGDLGSFGGTSTIQQPTRSTFPTTSTSNGKSSTSTSNFDFIDSSSTGGGGSKPADSFNFLDTMLKS